MLRYTLIIAFLSFSQTSFAQKQLTIEGNQIWVRSTPKTGDVVMKLDDGTVCKVLEKGEGQTIRGHKDYWYKIVFNGVQGWVFGSQTSLKQIESLDDFEIFLDFFLRTYYYGSNLEKLIVEKSWKTSHFMHPDIGVFRMYNPGAACVLFGWDQPEFRENKFLNYKRPNVSEINYFQKMPVRGFCEPSEDPDGVYYKQVDKLPSYPDMSNDFKMMELPVPEKYQDGQKAVVKILNDGWIIKIMYFMVIEGKWRLIVVNDCDCSA